MSARRPAKAPPRPPLALPRPSGTRTRATGNQAPSKPPPLTFLADEFVEDDVEEFLPQEFVVEDRSSESAAGFAGPSDPPPRPVPVAQAAKPLPYGTAPRARTPARVSPWIPTAVSAAFALVAIALAARSRAPAETRTEQALAAPPPLVLPASAPQPVAEPPASPPVVSASALPAIPEPALDAPAASTLTTPQPPPQDTEAAKQAKLASQNALELGKVTQAITLGEQSVLLDATDAEGWLILGAAYLQRGSFKDARRCFSSCVKEATRGPRSECSALLR